MKNFTNNFKQFTSRLSARWLIMALMLLLGAGNAWAANKYTYDYIFLDLSGFTSWASDGATFKVGLNTWDNTGGGTMSTFSMTKVPGETYIYYAKVSSALTSDRYGIKFSRCSSSGSEWNSFFSSYSSGNCGKPSDWNSGSITTKTDVYCIEAPTFDEVEVGSSQTSSGTYLFANTTTTPTISGTNSGDFEYVSGSSTIKSNGLCTISVKFTPSEVGGRTADLKFSSYLTTALTGTGKQSCQAPTSVSITRSDAPSTANICQGSTINLTAAVAGGSGNISYAWTKTSGSNDWTIDDASAQECTVTAGIGEAQFKIQATQCEKTVEATITLTADAKPSLELASSPTVCPNVQIDLDNYVNQSTIGTVTWYYDDNRTNVITDGLVTPAGKTTYYASASNGVCESEEGELIVMVYGVPEDIPAYTLTNATSCKGVPNSDGSIVLNATGEISYQLDDVAGTEWINLAARTHKLSATVNACPSLTKEWDIEVGEEDITPSATVTISGETSFCEGTSTELTCVVNATKGNPTAYQWYNGDNLIQDAINSTYSAIAEGNYKVVVTVLNSTCQDEFWSDEKVVTINPKPNEPVLSLPSPICAGSNFTLPEEDNNQRNITWNVNDRELTDLTAGTHNYTAKIIDVNGCESNEVTYTITVTALPEITSISQDIQEPVFYEDVTLTATATDGATVKWYEGGVEKAEGTTYVVTSATEPSKTVTAKAFLNGCESVAATKTVTFDAEDCNSTTRNDLIITCNPNGYYGDVYLHIWPNGESSLKEWPGYLGTWVDNAWKWEIPASLLNTSKKYDIIFNNNDGAQTQDLDHDLIPGNQYNYTLNHTDWGNGNNRPTMGKVDPIPLSQPAAITAPTVKTVYAESDEGEGNIRFKGQVVKTGCNDKAKLAVQYKLDGNDSYTTYYWNNEDKLVDIEAGKEFEITLTNIPDGTYDVRARIYVSDDLKGYGEVITIPVSTTKIPITSVVLTHVRNQAGEPYSAQELANLIYCAGETVWFKLEQNGSKFQDYQWISYPGTDLVGMYAAGTFSFTITDSGNVGIRLKNDENDDWVESNLLEFNTHPVAISPTISFENATICSNSTATLKLGALVVGQSYELYKEIENEGVYSEERVGDVTLTCNSIEDDLKFTGLNESGKYFVKGYTAQCPDYKVSSQTATLEIVDASSVYITLNPTEATTTPWMPVKLTVAASDDYTLEVPEGVEFNQNGNICSVKIPLPQGATGGEGQYDNVSFPQDATTSYTVTAKLVSTGGEDNPCAVPATATITLTPYVEECTVGH